MKDCSNRGKLMVMIGLLVIAPVAILPFYPQDIGYAIYFLLTGLLSIWRGVLYAHLESGKPISALTV